MAENVTIYGQDLWAFTSGARADFSRRKVAFDYVNVLEDDAGLERMMQLTNGRRKIPVIVQDGKVNIGFGGTWEVWTADGVGRQQKPQWEATAS